MSIDSLFKGKLDLTGWERYRVTEDFSYEGVPIPGLRQEAYQRLIDGVLVSIGVFHYRGVPAYIAWGEKAAYHCGFHAPLSPEAIVFDTRISCPEVKPMKDFQGQVTGFVLDGKETFGSGSLVPEIVSMKDIKRFLPLVLALALVTGWATVRNFPLGDSHAWHGWMIDFMAGFFLLFGGLKVADIRGFARAYGKYDLIAMRFPAWGYLYALLEVGLGVLYLTRSFLVAANVGTIFLLGIASIGVYRKLRKKDDTACACLGAFFSVPITWLTLAENILMIGMAVAML
ncbi:hypothetical protein K8Q93_02455 [Candidatus Parcubacteria bacterium]|nr:hypothetical protein [Candidatus Parcubacteria bacterium]